MIQMESVLRVADNSGAKKCRCIKVLGGSKKMITGIADVIKVSVIEVNPSKSAKIKKGDIFFALIVRTKSLTRRLDGSYISFDDNAVVLLDKDRITPLGTSFYGPISRDIRKKGIYNKIVSLASEVL